MVDELRVTHDAVYDAIETLRLAVVHLMKQHDLETIGLARKNLLDASNELLSRAADLGVMKVGRACEAAWRKNPRITQDDIARQLGTKQSSVSTLLSRYREIEEQHVE